MECDDSKEGQCPEGWLCGMTFDGAGSSLPFHCIPKGKHIIE